MRVPQTIPANTLLVYNPSDQTMALQAERYTTVRSQNLAWDETVPYSLVDICVQVLAANFEKHSAVITFLLRKDFEYLLEILSVELPIMITVPMIEDGLYWERCSKFRWSGHPLNVTEYGKSWKRLYIERHCEEFIQEQEPNYIDWDDVKKTVTICSPLVFQLHIRGLMNPRKWGPAPNPPDPCLRGKIDPDHIDLSRVLIYFENLTHFSITFGVIQCGMNYNAESFRVSIADITNLGEGLKQMKSLKKLTVHRSNIDDVRVNILVKSLISCELLESLEISHCKFGNIGAKSLGKLLIEHKKLKSLLIQNNKIGQEGAAGIAYALQHEKCSPIKVINLNYNIISDNGGIDLSTAIVKNRTLTDLNLQNVGMTSEGAIKIAEALLFSSTIKNVRLTNNQLGTDVNEQLIAAVQNNKRIQILDVRRCGVDEETLKTINHFIQRNRQLYRLKHNS